MGKLRFFTIVFAIILCARCHTPPPATPQGMVYVPGGTTQIGAHDGMPHERPVFKARVKAFFMDVHPVTVGQFRDFIEATEYVTQADSFGDAAIFSESQQSWELRPGANWEYPLGPKAEPAPDDHPVTQVSWNDAVAYSEWAGKRLPTEVEWEHAARGGNDSRNVYPWGNSIVQDSIYKANVWNGQFPKFNTNADGFALTSPVGAYGSTDLGLMDMGGNVWEWVQDWYRPYADRKELFHLNDISEKAQRGGSFLCEPGWCHGYRVSGRSHSTPESALFHVGFRCVKDI